jgi:hypothetical protein
MSFTDQLPVSVTTISIAFLLAIGAAALIYGQSRLNRLHPVRKKVSNKAGNGGDISRRKMK